MKFAAGVQTLMLLLAMGPAQKEEWESTRSLAESLHEIVMLHIQKGEFKEAVEEARKIFFLPFPVEKQSLLVEEAKQVSDSLIHYDQHALAREVLDEALIVVTEPRQQAILFKEKCYLLKKMGREKEAISCFKKALDLDNRGDPQN